MADASGAPDLTLEQDVGFERRSWRNSQITWAILLALMAAIAAGLFGGGPLSSARESAGPVQLDFNRFARYGASTRLVLQVATPGATEVLLSDEYLRAVHIERIVPEPLSQEGRPDGVLFRFAAPRQRGMQIIFDVQPLQRWFVRGTLVASQTRVSWSQFIYP